MCGPHAVRDRAHRVTSKLKSHRTMHASTQKLHTLRLCAPSSYAMLISTLVCLSVCVCVCVTPLTRCSSKEGSNAWVRRRQGQVGECRLSCARVNSYRNHSGVAAKESHGASLQGMKQRKGLRAKSRQVAMRAVLHIACGEALSAMCCGKAACRLAMSCMQASM